MGILIVYLIGTIISFVLFMRKAKGRSVITLSDLIVISAASTISWIGVVIYIAHFVDTDKVIIWRKK
jgi:hypothetical protein